MGDTAEEYDHDWVFAYISIRWWALTVAYFWMNQAGLYLDRNLWPAYHWRFIFAGIFYDFIILLAYIKTGLHNQQLPEFGTIVLSLVWSFMALLIGENDYSDGPCPNGICPCCKHEKPKHGWVRADAENAGETTELTPTS